MNECLENIVPWLEVIENAVYNDESAPSSFEKRFCEGNELIEFSITSSSLYVYFFTTSGDTVKINYSLDEFSDWLENENE